MPLHQPAFAHLQLAELHERLVNEHVQNAGVGKVDERGEEGGAGHGLLPARSHHRQGIAQDGAAHAKAQRIDLVSARDALHHVDGCHGAVFHIVVPGFVGQVFVRIAPAHHKGAVPLLHSVADEGVVRLQIKDVELVDARRHQQKGPFVHLGGEGLVFEQLEQLVLIHHRTLGGGHVAAHLEQALVGHRHMALANVVQQVLHALGNALTLGLDGFFLRLGVEGQKVARGHGGHPLLHAKADAGTGFFVALYGIGQAHQRAGVEQVGGRRKSSHGVGGPAVAAETAVFHLGRALQALRPQRLRLLEVLLLQGLQLGGRQLHRRHLARGATQVQVLEGLQRFGPAVSKYLLELLGTLGPECFRIHAAFLKVWSVGRAAGVFTRSGSLLLNPLGHGNHDGAFHLHTHQ